MREINVSKIRETVRELCLKANFELRKDVLKALKSAVRSETDQRAAGILRSIVENAKLAKNKRLAICQDTGMVSVYLEIGQDVVLAGGSLEESVNDGVKEAYAKGCLRKSIVNDPLLRANTNTNTPCVIHIDIVGGDKIKISVSPKGFGSENKSKIKMFKPTASMYEIEGFIIDTVMQAGPDACPPLILGVGIGGTFEKCAALAKKALFRNIETHNPKKHIAKLEKELLKKINSIGMGPMGLGGKTTALGVNIIEFPTHIAGLPVAVSVSCHATRSAESII